MLEYLRAFLAGRMGWHQLEATLIIAGAFGVFWRDIVVEVGGGTPPTPWARTWSWWSWDANGTAGNGA